MSWMQRLFGTKPKPMNVDEVDAVIASAIEQGIPLSIPDRIRLKQNLVEAGLMTFHSGYRGAVRAQVANPFLSPNEVRAESWSIPYLVQENLIYEMLKQQPIKNSIVSKPKRSIVIRKEQP